MKKSMTMQLAEYIEKRQLSTAQIARETGIAESKLKKDTVSVLNATEFLELCMYLEIEPGSLRE